MCILNIKKLALSRGENHIFSNVSFFIKAGQIALITGYNGSGKTSLLMCIAGWLKPNAGKISFLEKGNDLSLSAVSIFCKSKYGLHPALSVEENLMFWKKMSTCRVNNFGAENDLESVLSELDILHLKDLECGHLSTGQAQLVGFALLRCSRARLWLLDEPLSNLDDKYRITTIKILSQHCQNGGLAVVAGHRYDSEIKHDVKISLS